MIRFAQDKVLELRFPPKARLLAWVILLMTREAEKKKSGQNSHLPFLISVAGEGKVSLL